MTLPTAIAPTTRTSSPLDHTDDVIHLGSRRVTQTPRRLKERHHPRRFANKKQPPPPPSTKKKPKSKPLRERSGRKASSAERAHVGWIRSTLNKQHAVYATPKKYGQLSYWSVSDSGDKEMIRHEDIYFRPMFQDLSPDKIHKKLRGKMRRARKRILQDEK
ncbi:hypothetical protein CGMCC3_g15849 [Colletotrichum fructicola]|nr:uncharacterized protein CGMCC3_g15849 [Colletotrichum fructicola]KAE9568048.1 hypothetical protein CGMCC3_g15849 [Colletotrichum fructicola]KAF4418806.1 hypothetical protein CFRS1_v014942 [Colletotrichum fructicola]